MSKIPVIGRQRQEASLGDRVRSCLITNKTDLRVGQLQSDLLLFIGSTNSYHFVFLDFGGFQLVP